MTTVDTPMPESVADVGRLSLRGGWRIVARKEFADHVLSLRFAILMFVIALAGLGAVNAAAGEIRDVAAGLSNEASVFLLLFTVSADRIPSFLDLVGFLGPLLGIAFGFDAISSERSAGTLPRLVAQPIHRDDVIVGKFCAGLALVGVALTVLVALVSGYGIVRLGITPSGGDIARIATVSVVAVAYVGVWLALSILVSTATRRPATAVLATIAVWLACTLFGGLIFGALADLVSPAGDRATAAEIVDNARTELTLSRVSPEQLYNEASTVLLNPQVRTIGIINPEQLDQAVPDELPWDQSLLLVWPHIVALVAATVVMFVSAFVVFMRQEVRA